MFSWTEMTWIACTVTLLAPVVSAAGIGSYVAQGVQLDDKIAVKGNLSLTSSRQSTSSNGTAASSTSAPVITSAPSLGALNGSTDTCWNSWSTFWYLNDTLLQDRFTVSVGGTTTYETTYEEFNTISAIPATSSTSTATTSFTSTEVENGFTLTTFTSYSTETFTEDQSSESATTTTYSSHYLVTYTTEVTIAITHQSSPKPTCVLPSYVPQCEQEWDSYGTALSMLWADSALATAAQQSALSVTSPQCTQASVSSSICESFRTAYLASAVDELADSPYVPGNPLDVGYVEYSSLLTTESYTFTISSGDVTTWTETVPYSFYSSWPTSSVLAPGCTLGCARCAVSGGSVRLIYWPTPETSRGGNGTSPGSLGSDGAPVIAKTLGTTFTSPTLYISFASVYASDSCSGVGPTLNNVILPVEATQLSSLWATYPYPGAVSTASFNLADLNSPVPNGIYDSQLRCAASTADWALNNQGNYNTNASAPPCARTLPYEPLLVIPTSLLDALNPAWSTCSADIRGLYDPPIPLTPVSVVARPTTPSPEPTTKPTPAQSPSPNQASPTSTVEPTETPTTTKTSSPKASTGGAAHSTLDDPTSGNSISTAGSETSTVDTEASTGSAAGSTLSDRTSDKSAPTVGLGTSAVDPGASAGSAIASILGDQTSNQKVSSSSTGTRTDGPAASVGGAIGSLLGGSAAQSAASALSSSHTTSGETGTDSAVPIPTSAVVIEGQTYTVGATAIIGGTTTTISPSRIITSASILSVTVAGVQQTSTQPTEIDAAFTISGTSYIAFQLAGQPGTAVIADDADNDEVTLSVGGQATTIANTAISLATAGLLVASSTISFTTATARIEDVAVLFLDDDVYTAFASPSASVATIAGPNGLSTKLTVGGPAITPGTQTVSLALEGVVLDGSMTMSWTTATLVGNVPVPSGAGPWTASSSPSASGVAAAIGNASSIRGCRAPFAIALAVSLTLLTLSVSL